MPRLMPCTSSVPRNAVEALIVWIAPKWIGSPGLIVTHPNLSEEHFDAPPGALVPPPLGLLLPHAAATSASTATTPRPPNRVVFLIPPPSGPFAGPSSLAKRGPGRARVQSGIPVRPARALIYHTRQFCTSHVAHPSCTARRDRGDGTYRTASATRPPSAASPTTNHAA